MSKLNPLCAALAALALCGGAQAATVFDFESETPATATSFLLMSGGITMDIRRFGGFEVEIRRPAGDLPPTWGKQALSPFANTGFGFFTLTFSTAISSISVDVGDFAPSDADEFCIFAGDNFAPSAKSCGAQDGSTGFPKFSTLTLTGLNTTTFDLAGGSTAFPQSVFWDNITVTVVPEPGTYALMGLGLLGVAAAARRRRAA